MRATLEKVALQFVVLSDAGQNVGREFGLVFGLSGELRAVYEAFQIDIAVKNGTSDEWALPIPATYVVDIDGKIVYAYADVGYRDRADPQEVLACLARRLAVAEANRSDTDLTR